MHTLTGVILAGGKGLRMNGKDKGLILLHGKPMYQHIIQKLEPQVDNIIISANRNINIYKLSGYEVIKDSFRDVLGPLCGILSTLLLIKSNWAVFCSCDTPNIPLNYVKKLLEKKNDSQILWVRSKKRDHPTMVLIQKKIVELYMNKPKHFNQYNLIDFFKSYGGHPVYFVDNEFLFYNINTPLDLKNYLHLNLS
ncbi:molybdenum cofactor guanylyltransferase [Candidatus Pantoea edessiphila]|uniref:Molybdenum cofactor guanylyltransferase n=1 Tax=Candidatus Pantoea edessiphila TaxID=2044610 RepID=A0A2P5SZP9_9GAMM|nr:molybdenum cofactor guanylyltransferase MobA [Candidatus Pantoea edessiphila]PPI87796.1 molybdenum cofactor guanylyltransferase [Candidatus Pantoea edessiphila]